MDVSRPNGLWFRAVLLRSMLIGAALGVVSLGGSSLVLATTGTGTLNAAVLISTILLALAVGLWAGAPEATQDQLSLRERWLSAAAVTAVAGSFATFSTLYQQLYPGGWWRVAGLLLVVAAPCYALGLLVPVVLTWAERWLEGEEADHAGWGGLAPLMLGILGGAAIAALVTGLIVLPRWSPASLIMLMAVLLLLPIGITDPAVVPPRETVVFKAVTPFGSLRVSDVAFPGERQAERRLYLNEEEESSQLVRSGAPTLAYIAAAERWLSQITPSGASYLFLGGGAYTLPRRIAERDARATIVVVELDPEVTRIAYSFFGVKVQHGITSIHGDARGYLDHYEGSTFDRIYVDVYGGREALPHTLVTREAAQALARRLGPSGIAAINVIGMGVGEESRRLWSVVTTFAEVFPRLALYVHLGRDFPEPQNFLLAVAVDSEPALPESAGLFELWPRQDWPTLEGVTLFRDLVLPEGNSVGAGVRRRRETSS